MSDENANPFNIIQHKGMTDEEAIEILDTEFDSVCFDKTVTVKIFLINLSRQFYGKPRQKFECDVRRVIRIIREIKCFNEHDFRTARKLFHELLNFLQIEGGNK